MSLDSTALVADQLNDGAIVVYFHAQSHISKKFTTEPHKSPKYDSLHAR